MSVKSTRSLKSIISKDKDKDKDKNKNKDKNVRSGDSVKSDITHGSILSKGSKGSKASRTSIVSGTGSAHTKDTKDDISKNSKLSIKSFLRGELGLTVNEMPKKSVAEVALQVRITLSLSLSLSV